VAQGFRACEQITLTDSFFSQALRAAPLQRNEKRR
jgi:hypothetical protein